MNAHDSIDTLLFDLDGTLLDSLEGVRLSMAHVIAHNAPGSSVCAEELVSHVGKPLREILSLLNPESETHLDSLVSAYLDHNQRLIPNLNLFAGVPALLNELQRKEMKLGIVTSKRRDSTELSLRKHSSLAQFHVILTSDDSVNHKPHPEPILKAMAILGSEPDKTVYVGDAVVDLRAARAAGCCGVAALWGTMHRELLLAEMPHYAFSHPLDILSLVSEYS